MRKSFYEIYVNCFLIPKKATLLHIHYNTGNSFFLAFSRFPEKKKSSATQGSADDDHCLKYGTFRRLCRCLDPLSRFIT